MTARRIRPDGTVEREWPTSRPDLARGYCRMTAENAILNVLPE